MKKQSIFEFPSCFFDAKATVTCGQMFRFESKDGGYLVRSCDKECFIKTEGQVTRLFTDEIEYFIKYFDLERDYAPIYSKLAQFPELEDALAAGKGIRIINGNLIETIFSFIISANNNIPRISAIIERLCSRYGEQKQGYYAFPELNRLADLSVDDYRKLGVGYRDEYLVDTAKTLLHSDILERLPKADSKEANKLLLSLKGVGQKVADCIMLFALHRTDSFPVDTWIFKSFCSDTLDSPSKVRAFFSARYGQLSGYAQQCVFYNAISQKNGA